MTQNGISSDMRKFERHINLAYMLITNRNNWKEKNATEILLFVVFTN